MFAGLAMEDGIARGIVTEVEATRYMEEETSIARKIKIR